MGVVAIATTEPVPGWVPDVANLLATGKGMGRLVRYEPETGSLFWRARAATMFPDERAAKSWNTRYANKLALTAKNVSGYRHGTIFGKFFSAHRVAWAVIHDRWPENEIDHLDGDKSNNVLSNLRDVPNSENSKNLSRAKNNKSGVTGVHWSNTWNRWIAKIKVGGKTRSLGQFLNFEDAVAARVKASSELGFTDGHGKERVGA